MDGVGMTKILYHSINNLYHSNRMYHKIKFYYAAHSTKIFLYINLFNTCNNDEWHQLNTP